MFLVAVFAQVLDETEARVGFSGACDRIHVLDTAQRVFADSGFARQHDGIGFFSKRFNPFSLKSNIHCGSLFFEEMSRTTSSFKPRREFALTSFLSDQPNS